MEKSKQSSNRYEEAGDDEEELELAEESLKVGIQHKGSKEDNEFDTIVGAFQDVLVSEEFEAMVDNFTREHCHKFVETEENTHEMWAIHKRFKEEVETFLEKQVRKILPSFTHKRFMELLQGREDEVDEFIIDTLVSFDSFLDFKRQALAMKLRQLKEEEPEKYAETVEKNKDYAMVQEIARELDMENAVINVKGLGGDFTF